MSAALKYEPAHDEAVSLAEACRRLAGIHRATFYRLKFFKGRRVKVNGKTAVLVADINTYLRIQRGERH